MNCPSCGKNIGSDWLVCAYCTVPLKEKCPECGAMETIGRKFCKTKVAEANVNLRKYKENCLAKNKLRNIINYLMWSMILLFVVFVIPMDGSPLTLIFLFVAWLCIFIGSIIDPRIKMRAKSEFIEKHPEYKEILEHEEKGEK